MALGLIVLLLSVESSLQTSIIYDRSSAWWTAWLYKVGPLSAADFIILAVTGYTVLRIILKPQYVPWSSPYLKFALLYVLYLAIGLIYNLLVYANWKTFLYDVKATIYLFIPYLFLATTDKNVIRRMFNPAKVLLFVACGALVDFLIVTIWSHAEKPSYFGWINIPQLFPVSVSLIGLMFSKKLTYRVFFAVLLGVELLNVVNSVSLSSLFSLGITLVFCYLLRVRMSFGMRFSAIFFMIILINVFSVIMISNPFSWNLLNVKSAGLETRKIQLDNALLNAQENFPGLIGKGLGATWFVYIPIPSNDIFSVGTSTGATSEGAMSSPVQFVFNWVPPVLIHKWGLLGTTLLAFLLAYYFETLVKRLRRISAAGCNPAEQRYLFGLLIVTCVFLLENTTYVGLLRNSLVLSLMVFSLENSITQKLHCIMELNNG